MAGFSNSAGTFCVLSVLAPYAVIARHRQGGALDPTRLFTIITTVNLMAEPLAIIGQILPTIFVSYASIKRIEGYLLLEDKEDAHEDDTRSQEKGELKEVSVPIKMVDASFAWLSDAESFLKDVNVTLNPGKLHICIGPVASVCITSTFEVPILTEMCHRGNHFSSCLSCEKHRCGQVNTHHLQAVSRMPLKMH